MLRTPGLIALVVVLAAPQPRPREAVPSEWPLERIVTNLEARIAASPEDGDAHFTLGRAHAFAFALERPTLWAMIWDSGAWVNELEDQGRRDAAAQDRLQTIPPTAAQLLEHLSEGVLHLLRSCELGAPYGHPELTAAWLLETGAHLASRVDTARLFGLDPVELSEQEVESVRSLLARVSPGNEPSFPHELLRSPMLEKAAKYCAAHSVSSQVQEQARLDAFLQRFWLEQSLRHYHRAADKEHDRSSVVRESLEACRRLVRQRGFIDPGEEAFLASQEEWLRQLEEKDRWAPRTSMITPVLISLGGCKSLDELVIPDLAVPFDLDGDCVDELWPWISSDAGWLVWDPKNTGEITSGRQLFGSASAWLFFEDGYRVLDALDDDRSGELRGPELTGIAVWFDRDADGISDRGEVVPVEELGIVALATESTLTIGPSPANLCGLELADGRILPTYDWVLAPAAAPSDAP